MYPLDAEFMPELTSIPWKSHPVMMRQFCLLSNQPYPKGASIAHIAATPLSPGGGEGVVQISRTLEFERDLELGAVGFDLALGVELQIELDDFGDAKVA